MKRFLIASALIIALAATSVHAESRYGKFYAEFTAGGTLPYMSNLSSELDLQGGKKIDPGYGFATLLGRTFMEKRWALEFYASLSRFPSFDYLNDFEDFEGKLTYYGFALIAKRCILPESETIIPYIGAGFGYGTASLATGAGKITGYEAIGRAELEYRFRDNISIIAEGVYTYGLSVKKYSSPFLETSDLDVIYDSSETPLEDRFSSLSFRVGVKFWLKPPREY